MRRRGVLRCLACGLLLLGARPVDAQRTAVYNQPDREFTQGVVLYQNAKYAASKRSFTLAERKMTPTTDNEYYRSECAYYKAMCDVMLYRKNGASSLQEFVANYPESNRVNTAYLQLANFEYDYSRYQSAFAYYQMVDADELNPKGDEKPRFYFRAGYAAFQTKKYEEAKLYFANLLNVETRYTVFATYYHAYILYSEGHYQTALHEFEKIQDDPSLKSIIPLFMLQCHHVLGHSDKVLEMGPALMETASEKRSAEIGRLIGEAYYNKEAYSAAIPYLTAFYSRSSSVPDAGGCFILAYCYYKEEYYDSSVYYFQQLLRNENIGEEMKQSALYHLGYCYVQNGNKKFAMDAFADAAKMESNAAMAEDAAYHHAQLACEMGFTSYQTSIKVLEDFLEKYPSSPYNKRIYSYLVSLYGSTKDYDKALASLEKIPNKSPELNTAQQRLLFNKGVESFQRRAYGTALDYFDQCASKAYDDALTAQAEFWQGECCSMGQQFAAAQKHYQKFLADPVSKSLSEYPQGLFSMAYATMENVNYPLALRYLNELTQQYPSSPASMLAEAYARTGDCYYMQENYPAAIEAYTQAGNLGYAPGEYVRMQTALCLGAKGRYTEKADVLLAMERDYPASTFKTKVWQELASTYLAMEQNDKALHYYRKLRDQYPGTSTALAASTKMGLIYFNQGNTDQALNCFKTVAQANPSSEEGRQALVSIRNIYMSLNRIDEFFVYVKKLPTVNIEQSEQDSLTFLSAENFYMDGNCEQALIGFKKYLDTYPEGIFMVDAWKDVSDCAEKTGDRANMMRAYAAISQMKIPEAEPSARKLADMYYSEKEYKPALGYYIKLEELATGEDNALAAKMGKMRCYKALSKPKELVEAALDILRTDGTSELETDEARYFIAQTAPSIGEKELAMQQYEILSRSSNPDYASEARYMLLEQRFRGGFYDEAEKMIFDFISSSAVNDYYLAKTYLLWADIYYLRGNTLQAKQTLQSIVDNYEGEDLRNVAQGKLEEINQKEAQALKDEEEMRSTRYDDSGEIVLPQM